VLEKLKLQQEAASGKAKLLSINLDDRCSPDMGPNELLASGNRSRVYGIIRRIHCKLSAV
jgi:hypothetical protein